MLTADPRWPGSDLRLYLDRGVCVGCCRVFVAGWQDTDGLTWCGRCRGHAAWLELP